MAFTRSTWEGWDYLPEVLASWVRARDGAVFVAEAQPVRGRGRAAGRPIAVGRVALLSPTEAWMEGLRVDPAYRGRGVATAFEVAELAWAQAQGPDVVRYATGETNEASLQLGAKHGFAEAGRWRAIRPADSDGSPGQRGPARPPARRSTLGRLAEGGLTARAPVAPYWDRVLHDATLAAAQGLYEWRAWAWQRLTRERLDAHARRSELLTHEGDDGWAIGLLARERRPGETRLVLLAGDGGAAHRLIDGVTAAAGRRPMVRLPDDAPLLHTLSPRLAAEGWRVGEGSLVLMTRSLRDAGRPLPLPTEGMDRVSFDEEPGALGLIPAAR